MARRVFEDPEFLSATTGWPKKFETFQTYKTYELWNIPTCLLTLYLKIFRPLLTLVYFRWCSRQPSWHFSFHHYFAYDDDFFQRSQKISHVQPHNERYQFDVLCYHCWFWSLVLSRIQLESFYAFWTKGKSKWPLRLFEVINIKIGQYEVKISL